MTTYQKGLEALKVFYNEALKINPNILDPFEKFMDQLRQAYFPRNAIEALPGYKRGAFFPNNSEKAFQTWVDGLGFQIEVGGLDSARVVNAMRAMVKKGEGTIPLNPSDFTGFLIDTSRQIQFWPAFKEIAVASAKDLTEGAAEAVVGIKNFLVSYRHIIMGAAVVAGFLVIRSYGRSPRPAFQKNPVSSSKWKKPSLVQSLIFKKSKFSEKEAVTWAKEHGFSHTKVDEGKTVWKIRQKSPKFFQTFRTIPFTPGVQATIGPPRRKKK